MNMAINSMLGNSINTYNQLKGLSRKDVQGYIDEYKKAQANPAEAPDTAPKPEAAAPQQPKEINFQDLMESMTASGRGSFARSMSQLGSQMSLADSFMNRGVGSLSGQNNQTNGMFGTSPAGGVYGAITQNLNTQNYDAKLYQAASDYQANYQASYQAGGSGIQGMFNQILNVYA